MTLNSLRWTIPGFIGCLAASALLAAAMIGRGEVRAQGQPAAERKTDDPALERAREQVRMLDDLYKTAVIRITSTYVTKDDDVPAIMIAKQIFTAMRKNKWHSARLVDATGEPINDENSPSTAFEKEAFKAIRSGQPYIERVEGGGNDRHLLAATVVPAVSKNCVMCHPGTKVGEVLGFIRYDVPVK